MDGTPALAHELSCRYVVPLLESGGGGGADLRDSTTMLERWSVTRTELRDESNWVSLRFCEELVDWLGAELGPERLAESVTRAVFAPRALGVMYPVLRAFGSPRVGYAALAQLVPRMNKVSAVTVARRAKGRRRDHLPSGRSRSQGALSPHLPAAQGADRRRTDALEAAASARRGDRVSGARRRGLPL